MDFTDFYKQATKIKNLDLPGDESHFKMEPEIRKQWRDSEKIAKRKPKRAAVMALFYPNVSQETQLLLILRKTYKGVHSNQIGFPGGKVEPEDKDLEITALRETHEEVGVLPDSIEVLKQLTALYIPPSNFMVQPYLGLYAEPKPFKIQESEVEAVVEVLFSDFMDDENLIYQNLTTSYANNIDVPAFKLNGYVVWGATAMMLSEIKELLKQVL
ncbi:CoA pyrophosphatase [uncultured Croceitalea sp.]|uniref:NUDIX hydrolase n=1 Tax=uncultured Croceitalea sp. TaxID=1798908 RepID=UPI00330583C8